MARLNINLAVIHREQNQLEEAYRRLQTAEALLQEEPAADLEPLLYEEYGFVLSSQQKHKEAVEYLEKALGMVEDPVAQVPVQIALGKVYRQLKDYTAAQNHLETALATLKAQQPHAPAQAENAKQTAAATYQLGLVYQQLGDTERPGAAFQSRRYVRKHQLKRTPITKDAGFFSSYSSLPSTGSARSACAWQRPLWSKAI